MSSLKFSIPARRWWCTPLIPAFRRQRQVDICEFEANLVYKSQFQDRLQSHRETLSQKTKKIFSIPDLKHSPLPLSSFQKETTALTLNTQSIPLEVDVLGGSQGLFYCLGVYFVLLSIIFAPLLNSHRGSLSTLAAMNQLVELLVFPQAIAQSVVHGP